MNKKHYITAIMKNYREQLERDTEVFWRDTEVFWVDAADELDVIKWCVDNLDDCWFFEHGVTADCYYIKGHENIMAFKLRWT